MQQMHQDPYGGEYLNVKKPKKSSSYVNRAGNLQPREGRRGKGPLPAILALIAIVALLISGVNVFHPTPTPVTKQSHTQHVVVYKPPQHKKEPTVVHQRPKNPQSQSQRMTCTTGNIDSTGTDSVSVRVNGQSYGFTITIHCGTLDFFLRSEVTQIVGPSTISRDESSLSLPLDLPANFHFVTNDGYIITITPTFVGNHGGPTSIIVVTTTVSPPK